MPYGFLDIAATPGVRAAQHVNGSGDYWAAFKGDRPSDRFTEAEIAFIAGRDSFYMATVSESGWPYVQHRGGPSRLHPHPRRSNARLSRTFAATANISAPAILPPTVARRLILMDYPNRRRLKIYAHVETKDLAADPELAAKLTLPGYRAKVERSLIMHLAAFDWNCPQHITPAI